MIRIGIVGCGRILAAHLAGFRAMREAGDADFQISALCSRRPEDAASYIARGQGPPQRAACSRLAGDPLAIGDQYLSDFQGSTSVAVFTDYRKMIHEGRIDAVMDLTPHRFHHQIAAEAFRAKKHLLSQKPLAATVRAGRQMCSAADEAGVVLGTFECFRFLPATRALDWLFRSGVGGRPQMILVGYVGAWWAPDRIVAETPWRHYRSEAGGITLDLGVHFANQIRQVAGRPTSILGHATILEPKRRHDPAHPDSALVVEADADDTTFATIQFESGAVAQWAASWAGHGPPSYFGSGTVYHGTRAKVDGPRVQWDDGQEEDLLALYHQDASAEERSRHFPRGLTDWFALGQTDWLEAIRCSRTPEMNGTEGLIDLAAAYAILESSHARRAVSFEEVLAGQLSDFQLPLDRELGLA